MKTAERLPATLFAILALGLLACAGIGLYLLLAEGLVSDGARAGLQALVLLAGVLMLLALWALWRSLRGGSRQQGPVLEVLRQMAEGDLTASLPATLQEDALASALEDTLRGQRELLRAVRQPFEGLVAELYRIGKQNRSQANLASQLSRLLQEGVALQGDSRRGVETLLDSTRRAGEVGQGHQQGVRRGHNLVRDMSRSAGELRQSLQETSKTAKRQGELIQSVTSAAEYIQGLNTRVSVVAINTRIEAERAGEQGRPLLGIAEALGELLRESESEGRRITGEIRMLQNLSAESMSSLETTVSSVVTILEFVDRLDSTLEQTAQSAAELHQLLNQLQDAAAATSRNLRQLDNGLGELVGQGGEMSEQSEQLRQGVATLQQNLSTLGRALSRLRLDRGETAVSAGDESGAGT